MKYFGWTPFIGVPVFWIHIPSPFLWNPCLRNPFHRNPFYLNPFLFGIHFLSESIFAGSIFFGIHFIRKSSLSECIFSNSFKGKMRIWQMVMCPFRVETLLGRGLCGGCCLAVWFGFNFDRECLRVCFEVLQNYDPRRVNFPSQVVPPPL